MHQQAPPQYAPPGQQPQGQYTQPVIKTQPNGEAQTWMPRPVARNANVTPGLEYLDVLESVILRQKIDVAELVTGFEQKNRFKIIDEATGFIIGKFQEESDCFERQCCKANRSFTATVNDSTDHTLFTMHRPLQCPCVCPCVPCFRFGGSTTTCCGNSVTVKSGTGAVLGTVTMNTTFAVPCGAMYFTLSDSAGNPQFRMGGNVMEFGCGSGPGGGGLCGDKPIYLENMSGQRLLTLTKVWEGFGKNVLTRADTFKVPFLPNMSADLKATLIAAVILMDFNVWEKKD